GEVPEVERLIQHLTECRETTSIRGGTVKAENEDTDNMTHPLASRRTTERKIPGPPNPPPYSSLDLERRPGSEEGTRLGGVGVDENVNPTESLQFADVSAGELGQASIARQEVALFVEQCKHHRSVVPCEQPIARRGARTAHVPPSVFTPAVRRRGSPPVVPCALEAECGLRRGESSACR